MKVVDPVLEPLQAGEKSNIGLLDENGYELLDGRPMEPPLGFVRRPSLTEQIRDMVRSEALRQAAEAAGAETFEDADNFDTGEDDYDPSSPYEQYFEPTPVEELRARARADKAERERVLSGRSAEPVAPAKPAPEPPKAAEAPPEGGDGGKRVSAL